MVSGLLVVGVAAVLAHVAMGAAIALYDDNAGGPRIERRVGASWSALVGAMTLAVVVAVLLAAVGRVPPEFFRGGRGQARALGIWMALQTAVLAVGAAGLVVCASNAATYRRLRRLGDTPTGEVRTGPVAVTGVVDAAGEPARSPIFGADAVAWRWRFDRVPAVEKDDMWQVEATGVGGVPVAIDDGSGPVRVDPTDARLDRWATRAATVEPGDRLGSGTDQVAAFRRRFDGDRRRYRETVGPTGTEATVLGTAVHRDDGLVIADGPDVPFVIADGGRDGLLREYARRAAVAGVGGALAVLLGLRLLVDTFAVFA